ncbi:hypothetical protein ACWEQL_29620 [Kitasatospora sp. NPDC004240]
MRPSYDAEHPHSTTPIYDELYSEYRRLFRALPGDRSGEENLKFTGFAVRDGYPALTDPRTYPQQQSFHTYGGQSLGTPQFMPSQQTSSPTPAGAADTAGTGDGAGEADTDRSSVAQVSVAQVSTGQASTGQGWVAAGYLGPVPQSVPAPPAPRASAGGRHRSLLSLPPGRGAEQR